MEKDNLRLRVKSVFGFFTNCSVFLDIWLIIELSLYLILCANFNIHSSLSFPSRCIFAHFSCFVKSFLHNERAENILPYISSSFSSFFPYLNDIANSGVYLLPKIKTLRTVRRVFAVFGVRRLDVLEISLAVTDGHNSHLAGVVTKRFGLNRVASICRNNRDGLVYVPEPAGGNVKVKSDIFAQVYDKACPT